MQNHSIINKISQCAVIVISCLVVTGCEKELDFKYHDIESKTVIEGTLTADGADVTLRYTTPMDEPMDMTCLTDATVSITDLETGDSHMLMADSEGHFRSAVAGVAGHRYELAVTHKGAEYTSVSTMRQGPEIEDVEFQWVKMPGDDVAVLQIAFADADPDVFGDCYWVRVYRNGEIYKWSYIKDERSIDGTLYEAITTTMRNNEENDDDRLVDGDEVTVTVTHVSREFYDYLNAISSDSNGPRMFQGDFCLGYFLASEVSKKTTVFHPDEIEYAE